MKCFQSFPQTHLFASRYYQLQAVHAKLAHLKYDKIKTEVYHLHIWEYQVTEKIRVLHHVISVCFQHQVISMRTSFLLGVSLIQNARSMHEP